MIQPVLILNQKDPVIVTGGLVPRGAYAAGTDYAVGDSVDYLGSSYVMFVDAAAGTLPTDTTKWQVLANKGEPNTVTDTNSINMTLTGGTDIKADLVIQDTATVDLTVDASGLKADVIDASITNAKLANMATKTYKGRTSALTGVPEDVAVTTLKADLSLDNVDNTSDADKPISDLTQTALNAKQDTLVSGTNIKTINSTSILGSGNIDIPGTDEKVKYDAGDPTAGYVADKIIAGTGISVAEGAGANENKLVVTNSAPDQTVAITAGTNITSVTGTYPNFTVNAATQTTDISGKEDVANKSTSVTTDGTSDTKYPSVKAVKTYADNLVVGLLDYRGAYDVTGTNAYPATGGSGTAGAVLKGDMWIISVAGTMGTAVVQIGDSLIANVDTPAQTDASWNVLNGNIAYVPENAANKENSTIDTSTTKYPTVNLLKTGLDLKVISPASNTADYIPQWDGANSKTLKDGLAVPAGGLAGLTALNLKIDKTQNTITKEPTGFTAPESVVVTYDVTTQKVTLTGTVVAYYQGVDISVANPTFTTGWVSTEHANTTGHTYFLYFNGTNFVWATDSFPGFNMVLIAVVNYGSTNKYCIRECHGLMPWQDHREFHETIGTYKTSGGTFPSAQYVLSSTTAGDRRPNIDETTITDEDLPTVLPALTSKAYTIYNLTGASVGAYTLSSGDIIPLLVNNPYYNTFLTPNWGQTLMPSNSVATVWVYAVPVSASAGSQAYRYLFVQPQWVTQATSSSAGALNTAIATENLRLPSELNLGSLTLETPELVCIGKIIIDFTTNWRLRAVTLLTGNKFSQIGSPSGNYLSTVETDATLTGTGTGSSPLAVVQSYATKALDNLASVAMNAPLQWNNSAATSLDIAPTANTVVGRALTISAGSTLTGGTADMAGGNLTLNSGLGKGTGASSILFQTGTTLTTGSTLQTLSTKMTILGNGNVGIGTTTPTAALHIKAGTATAGTAPLKLTSGTVNTTPEAGAIEFDGTDFFCTI